jgi:aldose sugar dehydrogenase
MESIVWLDRYLVQTLTSHHYLNVTQRFPILLCFIMVPIFLSVGPAQYSLATDNMDLPSVRDSKLTVQIIYEGLNFPTSMAFLAPDDILVLEKNEGTVKRIVNGQMLPEPLLKVEVSTASERGMLGIAVGIDETSHKYPYVFLYYTRPSAPADNNKINDKNADLEASNALYRYELKDNKLVDPHLLLRLPHLGQVVHNGGVLIIGPDDNLYVSAGSVAGDNKGRSDKSDTKSQNINDGPDPDGRGGILRFSQDGEAVREDNGDYILGSQSPTNLYYAYGIRNSFGIDFDPETGFLWDTENHATTGDEINLVKPGFNSGWRQVRGIASSEDESVPGKLVDFDGRGKYSDPEFVWDTAVGPTAVKFFDSSAYDKGYQNDMFVADFHNGNIYHFDLNEARTELDLTGDLKDKKANNADELEDTIFGRGFGGITDMEVGPDGNLYVVSLYQGGRNCSPSESPTDENCVDYESGVKGVIFRISHK